MKVLVLGGEGMLGHKMFQVLGQRFATTQCTVLGRRSDPFYQKTPLLAGDQVIPAIDVADFSKLSAVLRDITPDVVVNCVGIVKQRAAAQQAIPAITINALLPHMLADWAAAYQGRVIHFSTDCVFSGRRGAYTEDDLSDAEDLYGKTKFLGEVATNNALTLRTSIIGRELASFASLLEWFLTQRGKTIRGFSRVIYSGVTTNYLAETVGEIIERHPTMHGLYQLASQPISKHDLLCLLRDAYGADVMIEEDVDTVSDRSLQGERFTQETGINVPPWPELVAHLAADPTPYERWR